MESLAQEPIKMSRSKRRRMKKKSTDPNAPRTAAETTRINTKRRKEKEKTKAKKAARAEEQKAQREEERQLKAEVDALAEAEAEADKPRKRGPKKGSHSARKVEPDPEDEDTQHLIGCARESGLSTAANLQFDRQAMIADFKEWSKLTSMPVPATQDFFAFDSLKVRHETVPGDSRRRNVNQEGLRTALSKATGHLFLFFRGTAAMPTNAKFHTRLLKLTSAKKITLVISMQVEGTRGDDKLAAKLEEAGYTLLSVRKRRYYEVNYKDLVHAFNDKRRAKSKRDIRIIHDLWAKICKDVR